MFLKCLLHIYVFKNGIIHAIISSRRKLLKELLGKIIDKTESLTNNPHLAFNFFEIFYLLDIVSVIVFKEDICSFAEKDFELIFKVEYFLFAFIFLMSFFTLHFISVMTRLLFKKLFDNLANIIDDFVHKDKKHLLWSILILETFARKNDKSILYEKICEQKRKASDLSKQLNFNFLLGFIFFIHLAVCKAPISGYISNIKADNPSCYWIFMILSFFIISIIIFRFLHSFLSSLEYYVEHIESQNMKNI